MKPRLPYLVVGLVGFLVLLVFFFSVGGTHLVSYVVYAIQKRHALTHLQDGDTLMKACLLLASNSPHPTRFAPEDERIPWPIRNLKPMWVSADENHVTMECGEGWDKFGYCFRKQFPHTNTWILAYYSGGVWKEMASTSTEHKRLQEAHGSSSMRLTNYFPFSR